MRRKHQISVVLYLQESTESSVSRQMAAVREAEPPALPLLWVCRGKSLAAIAAASGSTEFLRERGSAAGDLLLQPGDDKPGEHAAARHKKRERDNALLDTAGRLFERPADAADETDGVSENSVSLVDVAAEISSARHADRSAAFAARTVRRALRRTKRLKQLDGTDQPLYLVVDLAVPELRESLREIVSEPLLLKRWQKQSTSAASHGEHTVVRKRARCTTPIERSLQDDKLRESYPRASGAREYLSNMNGEALLPVEGFDVLFSAGHLRGFAATGVITRRLSTEPPGRITVYGRGVKPATVHAVPQGTFSFEEELIRGLSAMFTFHFRRFSAAGSLRTDYYTNDGSSWIIFDAELTYPTPSLHLFGDLQPARLPLFRGDREMSISAEAGSSPEALVSVSPDKPIAGSYFRFSASNGEALCAIAFAAGTPARQEICLSRSRGRKQDAWHLLPFGRHHRLPSAYWAGVTERAILALTPRHAEPDELHDAAAELKRLWSSKAAEPRA